MQRENTEQPDAEDAKVTQKKYQKDKRKTLFTAFFNKVGIVKNYLVFFASSA